MLQPGPRLGKYSLIHRIGAGGFATVYLGEHIYLKTLAAVKVLHFGADMKQEDAEKFLREARTIAALKHSRIVSILDFDVEDGIPFLIMDYAPNGSLSARHGKEQILDSKTVASYTIQVAEALQFAHEHQVVHCDVKPENMLLDQNNNVLLSDFGIAVVMHTNFKMSTVVGTMQYMPPEQFSARPVTASDQYALAVCIYRWLCGRFPFDGRSPLELCHQHMYVAPPSPSQINPQIPSEAEQVILTALAKDPAQRFSNISAFASALERAMQPKRTLPATQPVPSAPPLPAQERSVALDVPSMLLPSLTSLLPPADKKNMQWQPEISLLPPLVLPSMILAATPTCLTYSQHTGWVSAVAWSPDGKRLASASWDKTVHIWDAASGKTLLVYRGHTQPVKSVAWSPDGGYIASGAWDNNVQVWDTVKGIALPDEYWHKAQIETVAWSPNGVYIASAGHDSKVQVWRATDQYPFFVYEGHKGPVWSIAWSPHSQYIASASHDGTVQVWKALTGERVQVYHSHNRQVATVSWSNDGRLIASGDYDGWVHIWSNTDGNMLLNYHDPGGAVKALNWSPQEMRLASAVKSVQIWHLTTPLPTTPSFTYKGHTDWVNTLDWSPDGQRIATASDDKTVQVWEVR